MDIKPIMSSSVVSEWVYIRRALIDIRDNFILRVPTMTITKPTSAQENRGGLVREEGGAGVADKLYFSHKNASDVYAWRDLASAPTLTEADARYVNVTGDTMTGDLTMQSGDAELNLDTYTTSASTQSILSLRKSKSATVGTQAVVATNDLIGRIAFAGSDGTNFEDAARIEATVDTTPGDNDMPGRLTFSTSVDGSVAPDEKLKINRAAVIVNENGNDYDTRIEGDTDANLVFVDASTDCVGIGTSSPTTKLHVAGLVTQADPTDTTKRMTFALSGISASTTRTLTVPNASGTIALVPTITQRTNSTTILSNSILNLGVSCSAGETIMGGGCGIDSGTANNWMMRNHPTGSGWSCTYENRSGANRTITAYAICMTNFPA